MLLIKAYDSFTLWQKKNLKFFIHDRNSSVAIDSLLVLLLLELDLIQKQKSGK